MLPHEMTTAELLTAIANRAQAVNDATGTLVGQLGSIGPLIAEAAKRLAATIPAPTPEPVPEPEPEPDVPTVPEEPRPEPWPRATASAPIKVQSAPGLAPLVVKDLVIDMGNATSGIEMASPDFWPPKGPKTDQDWNRALTVRRVTIYGGSPAAGKDWGLNVFACRALTLEDVHVSGMLKEHGAYMHNPAGPTVMRRCKFTKNGGQGVQETRRMPLTATDNYEGPLVVPYAEDTLYAEDCTFAENGIDGSRAAWAGAFYAARHRMDFDGCVFEALEEAPKVEPNKRAGAHCVAPQRMDKDYPWAGLLKGDTFPGLRHRTGVAYNACVFASRTDAPRETVQWGSLRHLFVAESVFAGTKVLIEDPLPEGKFTITRCSGRLPIYVSRGYQKPAVRIGWTDEGIDMTGAEMLAKLPAA